MYDVIGDIHGHAGALERLLEKLGYEVRDGCWRHLESTAVFLGDFVDRGPEIKRVLEIVRAMVDRGGARAVMGNHEFNATAFHLPHAAVTRGFLRERSYKNIRQFHETVRQLGDDELDDSVAWFQTLPLWLDLGGLRVVHACWDPPAMEVIDRARDEFGGTGERFFRAACEERSALFDAVEIVLKGKEMGLPSGRTFLDKDGHERGHVRMRWFANPAGETYRSYAFAFNHEDVAMVPDEPLARAVLERAAPYPEDAPPVFFGHYWMPGDRPPRPLAPNVACLDTSVAKGGALCAYRWSGERQLRAEGFVSVPA